MLKALRLRVRMMQYQLRLRAVRQLPERLSDLTTAALLGEKVPGSLFDRLDAMRTSESWEKKIEKYHLLADFHRFYLTKSIEPMYRARLNKVPIVFLPLRDVNAAAYKTETDAEPAIALSLGLLSFLMYANALWFNLLFGDRTTKRARLELFKRQVPGLIKIILQSEGIEDRPLPETSEDAGLDLTVKQVGRFFQLRFVIAHELAHIKLGHLRDTSQSAAMVLSSGTTISVIRKNWTQEFEADDEAIRLLLTSFRALTPFGIPELDHRIQLAVYSAPLMFFSYLHMVEKALSLTDDSSSHPSSKSRMSRTLNLMKEQAPNEITKVLEGVATVSMNIADTAPLWNTAANDE